MKKKTINLKSYLESIDFPNPKYEMIKKIAQQCGVRKGSVYRWISGKVVPDKLKQEKISELTGIPVENLFDE
ncbi:MAG: helix-turn-helix domain-containing protein [Candidatus Azobacteroides sp.]|nr:helix-turn-helix domain-containing protein [Candidatus Azobacteroides sp.]